MLYIFRIKLACTTRPYGVVQAKEGCDTQWSKFVDLCDLCHSRCRQQVLRATESCEQGHGCSVRTLVSLSHRVICGRSFAKIVQVYGVLCSEMHP